MGGRKNKNAKKAAEEKRQTVPGATWADEAQPSPRSSNATGTAGTQGSAFGTPSATASQAVSAAPPPAVPFTRPTTSSAASTTSSVPLPLPVRQRSGPDTPGLDEAALPSQAAGPRTHELAAKDVSKASASTSAASQSHGSLPTISRDGSMKPGSQKDVSSSDEPDQRKGLKLVDETYAPRMEGSGTSPIKIESNFYTVHEFPDLLYQYSISFDDARIRNRPVKNRSLKRMLINQLLRSNTFSSIEKQLATNWTHLIVSKVPLKEPELSNIEGVKDFLVQFKNQADAPDTPPENLSIKVTRLEDLDFNDVARYINGQAERTDCSRHVTALNIICQKYPSKGDGGLVQTGTNKYFESLNAAQENEAKTYDGRMFWNCGLHPRKGYFASVRLLDQNVMLNVNVAATAFYDQGLMCTFLESYFGQHKLQWGLSVRDERELRALVKTLQVRYIYDPLPHVSNPVNRARMLTDAEIPGKGRLRRINDLGRSALQEDFIHPRFGQLTVQTYFDRYLLPNGRRLRYPKLPVVNTGGQDRKAWIPLEMLWIVPHQPLLCNLRSDMLPHMINFARRIPKDNAELIQKTGKPHFHLDELKNANSSFGIKVASNMHVTVARCLNRPQPIYNKRTRPTSKQQPNSEGRWRLDGMKFNGPKPFGTLSVINTGYAPPALYEAAANLLDSFAENMGKYLDNGAQATRSVYANSPDSNPHNLDHALGVLKHKLKTHQNPRPVLITLAGRDEDNYAEIKRWGDRSVGIPTICVVWDKLENAMETAKQDFFANIALKANLKLGGTNHCLEGCFDTLKDGSNVCDTMIVGADTTHPGARAADHCPSTAAIVASMDGRFANYPGSMRLQRGKEEMIEDLGGMMRERLAAWKRQNGKPPARILFYRDGVSESQFAHVKKQELPKIRAACVDEGIENPKITLVVVGKRHHTRFYPTTPNNVNHVNRVGNFHSGLVVDHKSVRLPYYFDFYLQSHSVGNNQGSARSAHYFVIENGMNLGAAELQRLTYNLCFLYARSVTAVSYATPAYYADKLCDRGRCYLRNLLAGNERINANFGSDEDTNKRMAVTAVENDQNYWRTTGSSGRNPWHGRLDDIMFYL